MHLIDLSAVSGYGEIRSYLQRFFTKGNNFHDFLFKSSGGILCNNYSAFYEFQSKQFHDFLFTFLDYVALSNLGLLLEDIF